MAPEVPVAPVVFRIPMRTRFRGQTVREGVLLHGPAGWGEFSPFPEYGPRESPRWPACAREAAFEGWPEPVRDSVPVNATVPAVDPEQAHELVRSSGCATAKVKVAEPGRPCATIEEPAAVRRAGDVPIAADESIRRAEDPLRVRAAEAADVAVVKVQPLGGVRAAPRVVEACGLPAVVSSAVETSVGLAAGLAPAAALPALPYACGLGTAPLLSGDVVADPLVPVGGRPAVRRPAVDFQHLSAFEIESPQWLRRMQEASR
ncbi:enolase C-terminal domain-like protein [Nonomuraea sp. GTA35]|uniref:enolase C-terminal domain-like protein n=1 Tax=Nonomuraea sp. GTA35 TaxID=1676746 RepID=UPI0035C1E9C7